MPASILDLIFALAWPLAIISAACAILRNAFNQADEMTSVVDALTRPVRGQAISKGTELQSLPFGPTRVATTQRGLSRKRFSAAQSPPARDGVTPPAVKSSTARHEPITEYASP